MNQYVNDTSKLTLSLDINFEKKPFSDCLESHAPTCQVKLTRSIAPWMKEPQFVITCQKILKRLMILKLFQGK